jgi:hypothetical protein
MAIRSWAISLVKKSTMLATITLDAGDTSTELELPEYPDKTVHIYGTFGDSAVALKGLNDAQGNGMDIHRTDDPTVSYSAVVAETMGHLIENPRILKASASGTTGTDLTVVIVTVARH